MPQKLNGTDVCKCDYVLVLRYKKNLEKQMIKIFLDYLL